MGYNSSSVGSTPLLYVLWYQQVLVLLLRNKHTYQWRLLQIRVGCSRRTSWVTVVDKVANYTCWLDNQGLESRQ